MIKHIFTHLLLPPPKKKLHYYYFLPHFPLLLVHLELLSLYFNFPTYSLHILFHASFQKTTQLLLFFWPPLFILFFFWQYQTFISTFLLKNLTWKLNSYCCPFLPPKKKLKSLLSTPYFLLVLFSSPNFFISTFQLKRVVLWKLNLNITNSCHRGKLIQSVHFSLADQPFPS